MFALVRMVVGCWLRLLVLELASIRLLRSGKCVAYEEQQQQQQQTCSWCRAVSFAQQSEGRTYARPLRAVCVYGSYMLCGAGNSVISNSTYMYVYMHMLVYDGVVYIYVKTRSVSRCCPVHDIDYIMQFKLSRNCVKPHSRERASRYKHTHIIQIYGSHSRAYIHTCIYLSMYKSNGMVFGVQYNTHYNHFNLVKHTKHLLN